MKLKLILTLVAFFTLSCTKKAANENEILLGAYGSSTGATASFGVNQLRGTQMAINEVNAAGGINGKKIKLINYDNKSDNDETLSVVNRLITQDKVVAIVGEFTSGRSKIGGQIAQEHKIPMLSPGATNPDVTKIGNYIFRSCFIDPFQGYAMAKFMVENLKLKRAAILRDVKNDYSVGLANSFAEDLKKFGGTVVADVSYQETDLDFKSQLTSIKGKNPEAIFIPGYYNEVALIAKQARELGMKQVLLGGDGWSSPKLYEIAKDAINGGYFSNHYSTESKDPKTVEFISKYKEKFHEIPDVMAAVGYDGTMMMLEAIRNSNPVTSENIRNALANIKDFHGATGKMTIDENRNAVKGAAVVQVNGENYKFITEVTPN